ncbi:MAG TPA: hypothetical protein VGG28_05300 [Kofleriaceae bacterium]|jgi:hypothetical protein
MHRVALSLVVVIAACSSGFETGPASLTGISPMIQSAGAVSFTMADASGTTYIGWELQFFSNGSGYDCLSNNADEVADLFIWTDQTPNGSTRATLPTGDVSIVPADPPMVPTSPGAVVGHFAIDGVHQVTGDLTLSDVHETSSNQIDRFVGSLTAAGTSDSGDDITVSGSFTAPVCE